MGSYDRWVIFLSTLPARGATENWLYRLPDGRNFYPRSPRGERHGKPCRAAGRLPISIHAPREGSDLFGHPGGHRAVDFYPRSPRGERRLAAAPLDLCVNISIHAPREGSDRQALPGSWPPTYFYPRSPRGERLSTDEDGGTQLIISIHAPREGSDLQLISVSPGGRDDFYPRSPRGERPTARAPTGPRSSFLSTLPARGATTTSPRR